MIRFNCTSCGTEIEAETARSGLQVVCGNCHQPQTVPLPDFLPRTACRNCSTELTLTADQAGTLVKCSKCGVTNVAPTLSGGPAGCAGWAGMLLVACGGALWALGLHP